MQQPGNAVDRTICRAMRRGTMNATASEFPSSCSAGVLCLSQATSVIAQEPCRQHCFALPPLANHNNALSAVPRTCCTNNSMLRGHCFNRLALFSSRKCRTARTTRAVSGIKPQHCCVQSGGALNDTPSTHASINSRKIAVVVAQLSMQCSNTDLPRLPSAGSSHRTWLPDARCTGLPGSMLPQSSVRTFVRGSRRASRARDLKKKKYFTRSSSHLQ